MKNFTDKEYIKLLTGDGMWHTAKIDELTQIHLSDGPHGLRKEDENAKSNNDSIKATCFPTASAIACSFDETLAYKMGEAIGKEAYNERVSVLLGPGVNMKRSPLCGRNFEYYSEDPYLAGILGTNFVNGCQSVGVGTSLKHFCGNNQETKRMTSNSVIDEKALREIYLGAFEMVVKNANPATIMASYNKLDNLYLTENKRLLTDILREEWGFKGLVVSDWGACLNLTNAVKAGMDLEMPDSGGIHYKKIYKDYKKGNITLDEIKVSSNRVLNLIDKYKCDKDIVKKDTSNNHKLAVEIEENSAVLLKNEGVLPLTSKDITVIGALAKNVRYQGGGSSHINTTAVDAITALENLGFNIKYEKGYLDDSDTMDNDLANKAIELAKESNTILFFGGLPDFCEGEGYDRKTYDMPNNQLYLLEEIYKVNKNIIFISFSGAPYNMEYEKYTKALLQMYLGGEGVMEAMANIISGNTNPSGRLAETIPYKLEDTPSYLTFGKDDLNVLYKESIYIGYRYYDSFNVDVRYPFGYGLSYTEFEYSNLNVKNDNDNYIVTFNVKNIGKCKGSVSSLLFIENPKCNYIREHQALKGFKKVSLDVNEEKEISIILNKDCFRVYDKKLGYVIPSGEYKINICGAINDIKLSTELNVEGIIYNKDERELYPSYFKDKLEISDEEFLKLYGKEVKNVVQKKGTFDITTPLATLAKHSLLAKIFLRIGIKELHKMIPDKPDTDPELMMMMATFYEGTFDAVCCHSGGLIGPRLEDSIVLSANGHKLKAFFKLIMG